MLFKDRNNFFTIDQHTIHFRDSFTAQSPSFFFLFYASLFEKIQIKKKIMILFVLFSATVIILRRNYDSQHYQLQRRDTIKQNPEYLVLPRKSLSG